MNNRSSSGWPTISIVAPDGHAGAAPGLAPAARRTPQATPSNAASHEQEPTPTTRRITPPPLAPHRRYKADRTRSTNEALISLHTPARTSLPFFSIPRAAAVATQAPAESQPDLESPDQVAKHKILITTNYYWPEDAGSA